jgi:hypothetical protein
MRGVSKHAARIHALVVTRRRYGDARRRNVI